MLRVKAKKLRSTENGKGAPHTPPDFVALSLLTAPNRARMPNPDHGPPCHLCTARCCKYFAFAIERPTSAKDFDDIRWYLMHEGIAVWVQDGDWHIEVRTVCRHLQPDNTCGIYETRPQVCRDYGVAANEPCEYFTDDLEYDLYFDSDDTFQAWAEAELEKRRKKRQQARRRAKMERRGAGA